MPHDKLPSILWLYGLPSAGKTTLARALRDRLQAEDIAVKMLDGDELRKGPCKDLGFTDDDRMENLRRAAHLALTASGQGRMVIAAFVTPKARHREMVREILEDKVEFIHVDCPLAVCHQRDVKGLYARAVKGQVPHMTGMDNEFELPENPVLALPTDRLSIDACVNLLMQRISSAQAQFKNQLPSI